MAEQRVHISGLEAALGDALAAPPAQSRVEELKAAGGLTYAAVEQAAHEDLLADHLTEAPAGGLR